VDFTVGRTFSSLYIILDIAWLLSYAGILLAFKKRTAVVVGVIMGVVYFLVDYGYFYHLAGTRHVEGADPLWFLLWLSMSYGFTNFAWIWMLLDRDGHAVEWSVLPILGWLAVGQLSSNFGDGFTQIHIWRGVGAYHGAMAAILLVGYVIIVLRNLSGKDGVNILWLMAIGIGVQFAWEAALLLNGIRPALWQPIVVNSLIETNLGLPFIYLIHRAVTTARAKRRAGADVPNER
jgi:hypothetical protein